MRCIDCHNFVMFSPEKGLCMLAKVFLNEEEFRDPRVACDFWRPSKYATIMKDGKLKYIRVDDDNLHDDDAAQQRE